MRLMFLSIGAFMGFVACLAHPGFGAFLVLVLGLCSVLYFLALED